MNASTLCSLISQRIPPEQFHLRGLNVVLCNASFQIFHENDPLPYDTPENRAIVEDVIKNYDTLAAAYEASQIPIKRQAMYKAEADPLYIAYQAMKERSHPDAEVRYKEWLAKVEEIKKREIK